MKRRLTPPCGSEDQTDCTGATDAGNHVAAFKMIEMQGGVFGAVSDSKQVIEALKAFPARGGAAA